MKSRITIDIDSRSFFLLLRGIFFLWIYGFKNIEIRESPSKRGIHLIGWSNKNYSQKKMYKVRRLAGDDKNRIFLDRSCKKKIKQVLFKKKEVFYHNRDIAKKLS